MLRPRPARWFEILAARDDATLVLEALARTGAVELEARSGAAMPAALDPVMPLLAHEGIVVLSHAERNPAQQRWVGRFFETQVRPLLVPVGLDPRREISRDQGA